MLEKFKYINHLGEVLEFGGGSLFANSSDLHDYAWESVSNNDRISGFKKGIVTKTIPVLIKCDTGPQGLEMRNKVFEVFEKDVLAHKYGKIVVGDSYMKCFVVGSAKTEYLISNQYMRLDLTIETDCPKWVKETVFSFRLSKAADGEKYLDYSHDIPFDYRNCLAIREIRNTAFTASDFRMVIYGAAVNPSIHISDHFYNVNVEVGTGEYLTIDSTNKTIYLTRNNGEKVNCFNNRNRDFYVFEKIPTGVSVVTSANEGLSFDITLLEERSEPKWT